MREGSDSIFSAFSDITKTERKTTIFLFQNLRMITSCDGKALAALTKASLALSWQVFTTWTTSPFHTLTHPFFGTRIFLKSCLNQMPKKLVISVQLSTAHQAKSWTFQQTFIGNHWGMSQEETCWSQFWLLWHSSAALPVRLEVRLHYGLCNVFVKYLRVQNSYS